MQCVQNLLVKLWCFSENHIFELGTKSICIYDNLSPCRKTKKIHQIVIFKHQQYINFDRLLPSLKYLKKSMWLLLTLSQKSSNIKTIITFYFHTKSFELHENYLYCCQKSNDQGSRQDILTYRYRFFGAKTTRWADSQKR